MYICSVWSAWSEGVPHVPGSLSSTVIKDALGKSRSTVPRWLVELIASLKYSDSSVMLSFTVDTIKIAWPILTSTEAHSVYGEVSKSSPAVKWKTEKRMKE